MTCPVCGATSMVLSDRLAARRIELGLDKKPLLCAPHALRAIAEAIFEDEDNDCGPDLDEPNDEEGGSR
jgi:hypothetical protein